MTRLTLLVCFFLTACDPVAAHRMIVCRHEAGPQPMAGSDLFGIAGALMAHQDPERAAWDERVSQCIREARR